MHDAVIGVVLVLAGVGLGLLLPRARSAPVPSTASVSAPTTTRASSSSEPAPVPSNAGSATRLDRARAGELVALKQFERHPRTERPIEKTLAMAEGYAALKRADLAALVRDVRAKPALLDDLNTVRMLHDYAHDPEVARQALAALARVDHPIGPDLLFDVWQRGDHPASSELAEEILHNASVRARATPALELAISLMETDRCTKLAKLLPDAVARGDRRSLDALERLGRKDGCGPKRDEDCFPCLRTKERESSLRGALDAVRKRRAPQPWHSRKVQPKATYRESAR